MGVPRAARSTPHEGEGDAAHRAAAVREVRGGGRASRCPTPRRSSRSRAGSRRRRSRIRFDTYFFLAAAPDGAGGDARTAQEIVDARWFEPARALEGAEAGELLMVFPTIKNLEALARFDTADALLEWAADARGQARSSRASRATGEAARIVLDDD